MSMKRDPGGIEHRDGTALRLYTYLPKDNTALTDGLLSTALAPSWFEKYRGRTGKHSKADVLRVLDSWEPEWTRSKALSALTEPIPQDAGSDFAEFARSHRLYSFDLKDLVRAKLLAHLRRARKGGGTDPVDTVRKERPNWHRKRKHLLFQGVPHYFVETTGGWVPPEFVREEKQASAGRKKTYESAEEIAADLKKRLKYGIRYSDGTYETSPDMWDRRDARDIVVQTPDELDASGIGMCHDVTQALIRRLRENRIRGTAVMLKGNHEPNLPTHSFVVTKRNGKYTVLDPLSYDSGHKGGYRSVDAAISGRIKDWKKEDEKGDVVSSRIRARDWKRRGLLDFLRYRYEKRAERIDIPSIYADVRKAYGDMGYPVTGDRLVVSAIPTYTNGKPVPVSVIRPNASGGNTQHDGTVRINPNYRAVMRHWRLKGSGRDFLRTIIGHELGHHIDRTVLSRRSAERRRLLQEIRKSKFHTVYTDSYGPDTDPRKLDNELLAEYLAKCVSDRLQ